MYLLFLLTDSNKRQNGIIYSDFPEERGGGLFNTGKINIQTVPIATSQQNLFCAIKQIYTLLCLKIYFNVYL